MNRLPMNNDRMIYFVLCDFGRHGLEWVARDPANMTRRETIIDIQSGELRDVIQVLECNPCEGICHDVTGDMLAEAAAPYVSLEAFRQAAE
jgi:hypothetical protein